MLHYFDYHNDRDDVIANITRTYSKMWEQANKNK